MRTLIKQLFLSKFYHRKSGSKSFIWKLLAFGCFPITSVAVAWFSWPHLIGTEVFYLMAGIGYKHSDFEKRGLYYHIAPSLEQEQSKNKHLLTVLYARS